MSDDRQLRRWRNQRLKAARNFVEAGGDRPVDRPTRADALTLRAWWWDRLAGEGLNAKIASNDLTKTSR